MDINYIKELIEQENENEFIEFKCNRFEKDEIGKYISAISNSAAENNVDYGYIVWGVTNDTHEILGTNFNPDIELQNEPLKHYLARNLNPSIAFNFYVEEIENKKIVILEIPSAKRIITEYKKERFIRIGSSNELLRKYPEREANLWITLRNGIPTILNTPSPIQNLTFTELLSYYIAKGLPLNVNTFIENLHFVIPSTRKYNLLAFIFSDNNDVTCRVSIFSGKRKSDNQYSLNDFGKKCLLITIEQILNYIDSFNTVVLDESNRIVERKEKRLFDADCLREIILNAFIHNDWVDLNAPMISIFTDRIEVLSYGSLPSKQTISGFFAGKSKPRSNELAEIFLQLRISERSGRGVTKVIDVYGKNVYQIESDFVKVTIPFSNERSFASLIMIENNENINLQSEQRKDQSEQRKIKSEQRKDESEQRKIKGEQRKDESEQRKIKGEQRKDENEQSSKQSRKNRIVIIIENNPNISTRQLMELMGLSKTTIQKYLSELSKENFIEHIGPKYGGYWIVRKKI